MAMTTQELAALEQQDPQNEPTAEQVREQRLSELRLKKLTAEQVETVRESIIRNRSVYESLRDR